jgi:hypothetical protein
LTTLSAASGAWTASLDDGAIVIAVTLDNALAEFLYDALAVNRDDELARVACLDDALARVACLDKALAMTLEDGAIAPTLDGTIAACLYVALFGVLMAEISSPSYNNSRYRYQFPPRLIVKT